MSAALSFDSPYTAGRSLVPLARPRRRARDRRHPARASAVFLAHLIATAQQAPQTRARRRAEPEAATSAYAAAARPDAARPVLRSTM